MDMDRQMILFFQKAVYVQAYTFGYVHITSIQTKIDRYYSIKHAFFCCWTACLYFAFCVIGKKVPSF